MYDGRWYHRLCHFFSLVKSKSLEYLYSEQPQERQLRYSLRNPMSSEQPVARTARFARTYFHNASFEWTLLDDEMRNPKRNPKPILSANFEWLAFLSIFPVLARLPMIALFVMPAMFPLFLILTMFCMLAMSPLFKSLI